MKPSFPGVRSVSCIGLRGTWEVGAEVGFVWGSKGLGFTFSGLILMTAVANGIWETLIAILLMTPLATTPGA